MTSAVLTRTRAEGDPAALRSAAQRLAVQAWSLEAASESLVAAGSRAKTWRGAAATAAVDEQQGMLRAARRSAAARTQAQQVLLSCARTLEEVAALRARAGALAAQDVAEQSAADAARTALRAATTVGPPLPAYLWDPVSPLARAAARLRSEADELAESAERRAVLALRELMPRTTHDLGLRHHVAGFGHGAWEAVGSFFELGRMVSPVWGLLNKEQWWAQERGLRSGLAGMVGQPGSAFAALLGLDQLRAREYGAWFGGLAGGALVPGGRAGRLQGFTGRTAARAAVVRIAGTGGRVVVRVGLRMPRGFPAVIKDLAQDRRRHILDGDGPKSGGHRYGGNPKKSQFPRDWSDDEIIDRIMATALRPTWAAPSDGRYLAIAEHRGVLVHVVIDHGEVWTAYPIDKRKLAIKLGGT